MQKIKSPLTGSENVTLEKVIQTNMIVDSYQRSFDIDVSKFFSNVLNICVYKCNDTDYRFYYPFDIEGDGCFYEQLQRFEWYYRAWKWEYDKAFQFVNSSRKVLEIGCGSGDFLEYLNNKGFTVTGLELNQKAIQCCLKKGLNVSNEPLNKHINQYSEHYDLVCSFQVMEHLAHSGNIIQDSLKALKKGGKLIIAVPNNDAFINISGIGILNMPPHHMGLWDKNSLSKICKIFNLKLEGIYFEPLPEYDYDRYWHMRFGYIIKQLYHINWRLGSLFKYLTKMYIRMFSSYIKGHTILAIYSKV